MAKLMKLPNGAYVDPTRVSSVKNQDRELDEPCVVVRTMDGEVIVIDQSLCGKSAHEARDEIAAEIDKHRS